MITAPPEAFPVWHVSGGSPARTGLWHGQVRLDPKPERRLPAHGAVQAAAVFDSADRVFVADMSGCVQAFSPEGDRLWQQRLDGAISATPAVDTTQNRLFVGTHLGWLYALQASDGATLWRRRLPTQSDARIVSDLLFAPLTQTVVASSWGGQFHALDAATGDALRSWPAGLWPQAGAAADSSGRLYCLRAVRGEGVAGVQVAPDGTERVLLRQPEGTRGASRMVVSAAPVVNEAGGTVYFCVGCGRETKIHAWSLREDRLLWSWEFPRFTMGSPALRPDGALVVTGMDGTLRAVAADGTQRFCTATGADYLLAGAVCDGSGTAFLGDPLGRVQAVDQAGEARVLFEASRSFQAQPSFDRRGNLHVPGTDGTVYVFRNRAKA